MKSLYTFICLILTGSLIGQGWLSTFDPTPYSELAPVVVQTPDGGFVVACITYLTSDGDTRNVVVIKTDANGNEQWKRDLDYSRNDQFDQQSEVYVAIRGSHMIIGANSGYGYCYDRPVFWEMDFAGNILAHEDVEDFKMNKMLLLRDGRLAIYGTYGHITWPNCYPVPGLMILDTNYEVINFTFDPPYPYQRDEALALMELDNGELLGLSSGAGYFYLERYDADGQRYDLVEISVGMETFSPSLLASAGIGYFYLVAKGQIQKRRQADLELLWTSNLPEGYLGDHIITTNDQGLLVAEVWAGQKKITKIDSMGYEEWHRELTVPWPGEPDDVFTFKQTLDNGFILTGSLNPPNETLVNLYLLKLDAEGVFGGRLEGRLVLDDNASCTYEDGETGMEGWIIEAKNQQQSYYATTDSAGLFVLQAGTGDVTVSAHYPGESYYEICNDSTLITLSSDTSNYTFFVTPTVFCPLLSVNTSRSFVRPCIENAYWISACNFGTAIATNTEIAILLDEYMTFASADLPYTLRGDTLIFMMDDVPAGDCRGFFINILIDCMIPRDSLACIELFAMPDSICNLDLVGFTGFQYKECISTIAPFDPNDKTANPLGEGMTHLITKDTTITYKIRFQNIGNDTAFNVFILDTLPRQLDISSFMPGSSSHDFQWKISDSRVLRFDFKDIMLPDSNVNEVASHGFVTYKIRFSGHEAPRQRVDNQASIYFDYNAPVLTEPAFHTIKAPVLLDTIFTLMCCDEDFSNCVFDADTVLFHSSSFPLFDKITTEFIDVQHEMKSNMEAVFCEGDLFYFNGEAIAEPGFYQTTYVAANGCDSSVTLSLSQIPMHVSSSTHVLCEGDSLMGKLYEHEGAYFELDTLTGISSCDTVIMRDIVVYSQDTIEEIIEMESGSTYQGVVIHYDTVFVVLDTTSHGCQQILITHIHVLATSNSDIKNLTQVVIRPNPFVDQLEVNVRNENCGLQNVWLMDMTARPVRSINYARYAEQRQGWLVDTHNLAPGMYWLYLETCDGGSWHKVIKQ